MMAQATLLYLVTSRWTRASALGLSAFCWCWVGCSCSQKPEGIALVFEEAIEPWVKVSIDIPGRKMLEASRDGALASVIVGQIDRTDLRKEWKISLHLRSGIILEGATLGSFDIEDEMPNLSRAQCIVAFQDGKPYRTLHIDVNAVISPFGTHWREGQKRR